MHKALDYMETAEQHAVSDEDVEQMLAQFPKDDYILAEDFTTWSETIYEDLQAEQSATMQIVANALALLEKAERFGAKLQDMAAKDAIKELLEGPHKALRADAVRLKLVDDSGRPLGSALVRGEALAEQITGIRDSLTDKAHSDHRGPIRAAMETTIDQLQIRASLAVEGIEDYVERRERADERALDFDDVPELLDELGEAVGDELTEQERLLQRGRRARQGIGVLIAELRDMYEIDSPHQLLATKAHPDISSIIEDNATNTVSQLVDNLSTGVEGIQLKMEQLNDEMAKEIARVQKGNGGRSSRRESFNPVQRTHEGRFHPRRVER